MNSEIKKIFSLILTIILFSGVTLSGEDYQYQYFSEKDEYVPFSDYVPKVRMHYYTVPHDLEDYYLLFGMKLYYNENSLRKNIEMLKTALNCKFRHPSQALVKVDTEDEYLKYRKLMFMHINLMIMRNYLKIGSRYDKKSIKFYDVTFAKDINDSLDIAEKMYKEAIPYWEEAKKHAAESSRIKITTKLSNIESERYRIITGDLDFKKIITSHITSVNKKQEKLKNFIAASPQQ
jgi:hypothetical protein